MISAEEYKIVKLMENYDLKWVTEQIRRESDWRLPFCTYKSHIKDYDWEDFAEHSK